MIAYYLSSIIFCRMLQELWIENFGIMDRLCFRPGPGLNVITGETGAGKSLLLQAVDMLLGGRAAAGVVRRGSAGASIEGRFVSGSGEVQILRREISMDGKSRAFINGEVVTLARLRNRAAPYVEIHGQHDQHKILDPENHIDWLDAFIGLEDLRKQTSEAYHKCREIRQRLQNLTLESGEREKRKDYLGFALDEIENLGPVEGEFENLEQERGLIKNGGQLFQDLSLAYQFLRTEEPAILDRLSRIEASMERHLDLKPDLSEPLSLLRNALYGLESFTDTVRSLRDGLHFSPERLEDIDDRLQQYKRLFKKYGSSAGALLQVREGFLRELALLGMSAEECEQLQRQFEESYQELESFSQELSRQRAAHASLLEEQIAAELQTLGMQGARVKLSLTREMEREGHAERFVIHEKGMDRVEFMLQANAGEAMLPLRKIASGGEMSRLMLALKSIVSTIKGPRTLIFDEIDTGVGGEVSYAIGERLKRLAAHGQVIVVTHLHQVAGFGQQHFKIEKKLQAGRTVSHIVPVEEDLRLHELARMMGSRGLRGLEHAREILQSLAS